MDFDPSCILSRLNRSENTSYSNFKEKQAEVLEKALTSDVMAVLPTGYGKTVVIQALPFLQDAVHCVIVVNPLNSIIQEQKGRFGDSAVVISKDLLHDFETFDQSCTMDILNSGVKFILGHPECITSDAFKKQLLRSALSKVITHLVVDEAHCILSWGKSEFRPAFLKLGSIRAILPMCKVLALTATATKVAQKEIADSLLMTSFTVISQTPDRKNIFLEVKRRKGLVGGHTTEDSYDLVVDPILRRLSKEGRLFPRSIIYAPLKWCGYIHHRAVSMFLVNQKGDTMCDGNSEYTTTLNSLVAQYHAPQTKEMKHLITECMQDPFGCIRLLLATEAYGMGADSPNVRNVIHIGPPTSMETYVQEIGRAGRDHSSATATLFYNAHDIAPNKVHLQEEMRLYCELASCRRTFLLNYFGFDKTESVTGHDCCDNCRKLCECDDCLSAVLQELEQTNEEVTAAENTCRKTEQFFDQDIANSLSVYFKAENDALADVLLPELATGLSTELANDLASNPSKYANSNCLAEKYPHLERHYVSNICEIISAFTLK